MLYGAPISVKWRAAVCGLPVTVEWSHAGIWTVFIAMKLYFFSAMFALRGTVESRPTNTVPHGWYLAARRNPALATRLAGWSGGPAWKEYKPILTNWNHFQFCPDHINDTGPVVLAENLSDETKAKLRSSRSMSNFAQGVFICLSNTFRCRW